MSQSAKAQEPSMEEILASIRRIIADDETKVQAKNGETATPAAPTPAAPSAQPSAPPSWPPAAPAALDTTRDDIDRMLSGLDVPPVKGNGRIDDNLGVVLDLTEAMAAPAALPEPPVFRTAEENLDVFSAADDAEAAYEEFSAEPGEEAPHPFAQNTAERPLISSATSAAVDSAFNALAHTVLAQNARTLEDLVQDMMRPMLKAWLDDNLPGLVERLVRAEIERVSRGRTG